MKSVTEEEVQANIEHCEFVQLGAKTTCCILTLKNGYEVIGTSACVNPDDYDLEIGSKYARERAEAKVWELMGYVAQSS